MHRSERFTEWGFCAALMAAVVCFAVANARAQDDSRRGDHEKKLPDQEALTPTLSHGEREHSALAVPLDADLRFERVVVGSDGSVRVAADDGGCAAGAGERLIYSNTLGVHAVNFPSNQPVSDDIATTVPNGCMLTRYRFKVLGKVVPTGAEGAYTVTYGLYTTCPLAVGSTNAQRDLVKIPGTEGVVSFPDDGPRMIEHVMIPAQSPVQIPTNVYLGIRFNRGNCGTVVGAPAMVGYSGDIWDFPGFPCNGFLGGFPDLPHASFWLEMFASDACPQAFVGYKVENPAAQVIPLGTDVVGVDDPKLIVDDCRMTAYEVGVRGSALYSFELRSTLNGPAIAGTQKTYLVGEQTQPQLQRPRFDFDPPVALNGSKVYLAFKANNSTGGVVVPGGTYDGYNFIGSDGAVQAAITCAGALPRGACCDPYLTQCIGGSDDGKRCLCNAVCVGGQDHGDCCSPSSPCASPGTCEPVCAAPGTCEAVCREATKLNCPFPPRGEALRPEWQEGEACGPEAFPEACGVAVCCGLDPPGTEICHHMTRNQCEASPPTDSYRHWQVGRYCDDPEACPYADCPASDQSCYDTHNTPGCCDRSCCSHICSSFGPAGAFCCNVSWDSTCVQLAETHCTAAPPNDSCAPNPNDPCGGGAIQIPVPGSKAANNLRATTSPHEPGFCCNAGIGYCICGPACDGYCTMDGDCGGFPCSELTPNPGGQGVGTMWFKWVQPIGLTSARIDTCSSNSPALDSIIEVFRAADHSSPLAECNSLVSLACNDDAGNCTSTQRNSRLCLRDLTPGETYYIMLAAKIEHRVGQYRVTIATACNGATESCSHCPVGEVAFVDPPDGVVDARRPHPQNHQSLEGTRTIIATGPEGATADCWTVCETTVSPSALEITSVVEPFPGQYTMELSRPIAPGAVTMVTYTDNVSSKTIGRFVAHPGNVNADSMTGPTDILALVDAINGVGTLAWGKYSGDLDHSGVIAPADIITLIDLFNGATGFDAWYGTPLPSAEECP